MIDREFVVAGLKDIATNTKLKETARVRAYELLGKELGMFRDAVDHTVKNLDPDPRKWTKEQLERVTKAFEEQVGPEIAAAEREAAIREMPGMGNVQ
jgi:hypothetical protein